MLRSIWLVFVYFAFLGLGAYAPFILSLGYVWVDMFRPQEVAYIILPDYPVAMIMGVAAFGAYVVLDRRHPPRLNFITLAQITLAIWSTVTLLWAVAPDRAWLKWDWAFKTMIFAAFIPYAIRSRVQIEAFLQVFYFSVGAILLPFGAKIVLSGGGYGRSLGLTGGNFGLNEGSTLAAVAVMTIPIALYLAQHAQLLPKTPIVKMIYYGMAAAAIFTTIGTFERTGVVGLAILALGMFAKSRHKILMLMLLLAIGGGIATMTSASWTARISTIGAPRQDNSALVRLLVWRWTFDYVVDHPLGGGFEMYAINRIELPTMERGEDVEVQIGRAFHSIYFEVLGEHGWFGFALFISMLAVAMLTLRNVVKRTKGIPELLWCHDLASTLQVCLSIMAACGAFIGIAYQPFIPYLLALTVCVSQYLRRVVDAPAVQTGWRAQAAQNGLAPADSTARRQFHGQSVHKPSARTATRDFDKIV